MHSFRALFPAVLLLAFLFLVRAAGLPRNQMSLQNILNSPPPVAEASSTGQFPCSECGHVFTRRHHYDDHVRTHTGERPFACTHDGCDKRFSRANGLTRHQETHRNAATFQCPHCSSTFSRQDHWKRHGKQQHGMTDDDPIFQAALESTKAQRRQLVCDVCQATFTRPDILRNHMASHSDERPFKCTVSGCGHDFKLRQERTKHLSNHNHDPVYCPHCPLHFQATRALNVHLKTHDPMSEDEEDEEEEEDAE